MKEQSKKEPIGAPHERVIKRLMAVSRKGKDFYYMPHRDGTATLYTRAPGHEWTREEPACT